MRFCATILVLLLGCGGNGGGTNGDDDAPQDAGACPPRSEGCPCESGGCSLGLFCDATDVCVDRCSAYQCPAVAWTVPIAPGIGKAVATDGANDILVAGTVDSQGPASLDTWVAKYGADGGLLWTQTYDPDVTDIQYRSDELNGVIATASGDVVVVGDVAVEEGAGLGELVSDIWVAAYDAEGNSIWAWTREGPTGYQDEATGIGERANGELIVCGSVGAIQTIGEGTWLASLDASGGLLWETIDDAFTENGAVDVAVLVDREFVASYLYSGRQSDVSLRWYSGSGTLDDSETLDSGATGDEAYGDLVGGVDSSGDGRVAVAGALGGVGWLRVYDDQGVEDWTQDIDCGGDAFDVAFKENGSAIVGARTGEDSYLLQEYDASGRIIWTCLADGSPEALAVDADGNVVVLTDGSIAKYSSSE
jgi:hypothetical protein